MAGTRQDAGAGNGRPCTGAPRLAATAAALAGLFLALGLLAAALLAAVPGAAAVEQYPSSPNHQGIAPFDPYLVFPENRPGNGVYLDNTLVYQAPAETILVHLVPLPVDGRFVYYARDAQGEGFLGAYVGAGDPEPRIREVAPGFHHVVVVLGGVVHKKMYRIIEGSILDLLPNSKTADGPSAGEPGVAFYHVASVIRDEEEGEVTRSFGMRLHLALFDEERTRDLDYLIINALPRVELRWLDETRIQVGLAGDRSEVLSISQFR